MGLTDYADREFLLATDGKGSALFWQLSQEKSDMARFFSLNIDTEARRIPDQYHALADKKVGIVGAGRPARK